MVSKGKENYANKALHVLQGKSIFCVFCLQRCMPLLRGLSEIRMWANLYVSDPVESILWHVSLSKWEDNHSVHPRASAHWQDDRVYHNLAPARSLPPRLFQTQMEDGSLCVGKAAVASAPHSIFLVECPSLPFRPPTYLT